MGEIGFMPEARGYISSGTFRDTRIPQHVQNLVIRDYCRTMQLTYILSKAEYSFSTYSWSQLKSCIREGVDGIVMYSILQLPKSKSSRWELYMQCLENEVEIHFACEGERISGRKDVETIELILDLIDEMLDTAGKTEGELRRALRAEQ